jgi:hypothetical protein
VLLRSDAVRLIFALGLTIALFSCGGAEPQNPVEVLAGTYELKSPSANTPRLMTSVDRIAIRGDGHYEHDGETVAGRKYHHSGSWSYSDRSITLDGWHDYAGVTSRSPRGGGQQVTLNCIVEFNRPPVIVVDPDQNIFYGQNEERSARR